MILLPFFALFDRLNTTVTMTAYSNLFESSEQGYILGLHGSIDSIGGIMGPVVGGLLFKYGGIPFVYGFCMLLCIFCHFRGSTLLEPTIKEQKIEQKKN